MIFKENVAVLTADSDKLGHLDRVVIDPRTKKVTDVVVRSGILSATKDKVVPINLIDSTDEGEIILDRNAGDLEQLPDYIEEHYVPITGENRDRLGYESPVPVLFGYYPYSLPGQAPVPSYLKEKEINIPEDTVALEIGATVIDTEGDHVGDIERVLVDPETDRTTHFVIGQGLLLKKRKLVPTTWVSHIDGTQVYLAVDAGVLDALGENENQGKS
jgi:sporulation protein YlmC with PRC-barrel domain